MATLIGSVTTLATAAVGQVGQWIELFTAEGNEILLLFCVALPLCGIGLGFLKRLLTV